MAQTTLVEQGIERVQSALRNAGGELERLQKELVKRRRQIEKDAQKRFRKLEGDVRNSPLLKRAGSFQKDAVRQLEDGLDAVLGRLQIASQSDLKRIDRKLGQISRKLTALEKERSPGASQAA